jgi:regulator of protease activity HflC (stomatin/prohibitin superfamily)
MQAPTSAARRGSYLFQSHQHKTYHMIIAILGLLLLVLGPQFLKRTPQTSRYAGLARLLGIGIIVLGIMSQTVKQIDAGQIGVQKLFGKVQDNVLGSGLHLVNPFVTIEKLDIKTQNYTMSGIHDEGAKTGDDAIKVLTSDGLEVTIDLTVLYRLTASEAPRLLRQTGADYTDKIVRPITRTKIRDNAVYYQAIELFSTRRDEFQQRIFKSIEADFKNRGLLLEQLLVRNITLPASVRTTIEQKINAEQDAQKMQFVLQKEKQEAERKRVEAQGIADYNRIMSEGLTEKQLTYEQIKAVKDLAASPNAKIVFLGKGSGSTPVIIDGKGN